MNIYTANQYIKDTFGEKLYKLSLNAGTTSARTGMERQELAVVSFAVV